MLTTVVSLLMTLGLLGSPADWDTLSSSEQNHLTEIVVHDVVAD